MSEEIQRNALGQFTKQPSTTVPFTSENAAEMQKRGIASKLEKQRKANDKAMIVAIEHDQGLANMTPQDGAALIVAKQTIKAISPDQPGTTSAARFVFQETGRSQERQGYVQGVREGVGMALLLADALRVAGDTVDGEYRELEPD